jgi:hypothetical protein
VVSGEHADEVGRRPEPLGSYPSTSLRKVRSVL